MSKLNTDEQLSSFLKNQFSLSQEGMEEVVASFACETIPKDSIILQPGQTEKKLKFVHSGFIREYYANEKVERNINFFEPGEFATDFLSFQSDNKTQKWQQSITKVKLRTLPKSTFNQLLQKYECGQSIVEGAFRNILQCVEAKTYNRLTKKPEELYQHILKNNPSWLQHIPQYHLASFLNIAPETLSRIRKRIS